MCWQSREVGVRCHWSRARVRCPAQEHQAPNPPAQAFAAAAARSRSDLRSCSAARTTRSLPRKARRSMQTVQVMLRLGRQLILSAAHRPAAHWASADLVHRSTLAQMSLSSHLHRASRPSCRRRSCSRLKLPSAHRSILVLQRTALLSQRSSDWCLHVPSVLSSQTMARAEQQHQQTRHLSSNQGWQLRGQSSLQRL